MAQPYEDSVAMPPARSSSGPGVAELLASGPGRRSEAVSVSEPVRNSSRGISPRERQEKQQGHPYSELLLIALRWLNKLNLVREPTEVPRRVCERRPRASTHGDAGSAGMHDAWCGVGGRGGRTRSTSAAVHASAEWAGFDGRAAAARHAAVRPAQHGGHRHQPARLRAAAQGASYLFPAAADAIPAGRGVSSSTREICGVAQWCCGGTCQDLNPARNKGILKITRGLD